MSLEPTDGLRVLHLSSETGFRGGEQQVLNLMVGLAARGVDQGLLAPAGAALPEALKASWGASVENPPRLFVLPGGRRRAWSDVIGLRRALADFRPTHLHAHTSHAHSLGRMAQSLGLFRGPLIVTRRVDFPLKRGLGNRWKYLSGDVRYIAISAAVKRELEAGGVEAGRIRLVHSGIDPMRLGGRRVAGPERDAGALEGLGLSEVGGPLWLCVAALANHKDHPTLLAAAAMLHGQGRRFQLALAGDGPDRAALEALSDRLGLQACVRFLGRVDTGVLSVLHRAATGFVLTSKLEGLGTAVLDAMAAGVPVVATAAGGIPESVIDGKTGWLCQVGDVAGVARAMAEVMDAEAAGDAGEVARRTHNAHEHVLSGFTAEAMVSGTLEAYRGA